MEENNAVIIPQSQQKPDERSDLDDLIFEQERWMVSDR